MKIGQVAPLYERVPPRFYGGTERVVSYLTEALAAQGHDVTLFASGDSLTNARLVAACNEALRRNPQPANRVGNQVGEPIERRNGASSPSGRASKQEEGSLSCQTECPSVTLSEFRIPTDRGSIFP